MKILPNKIFDYTKQIFIAAPIVFLFWLIGRYGVNVVFWDDLEPVSDLIDIQTTGKINWSALVALHNEHRIVVPRIIMLISGALTHYNTKVLMFISAFLLSATYLVFIKQTVQKHFLQFNTWDILYSVIVGFCLFSCVQYENLLWGFQIAWFLIEFCLVAGLASLSLYIQTKKNRYIIISIILAIISSFSSLHGLAIWPCYMVVVAIYQIFSRSFDKKIWAYMILPLLCIVLVYFQGYHAVPAHAEAKGVSLLKILSFSIRNLGSVISGYKISNYQIAGLLEISLILVMCIILVIKKQVNQNIYPLGIIIFSLGVAFMLGMGRSGWDIMPSRYMTFPLLAVVGCLALLKQFLSLTSFKKIVFVLCFLLLSEFCVYTSWNSRGEVKNWYKDKSARAEILQNYRTVSYHYSLFIYPHFKTKGEAVERIEKIENANLSVFYKGNKDD